MPLEFSRNQIRQYLGEMGYSDLSDAHLDLFIKDLRKLIRHEDKKRWWRKTPQDEGTGLNQSYESSALNSSSGSNPNREGERPQEPIPPTDSNSTSYQSPPQQTHRSQKEKPVRIIPGESPSQPSKRNDRPPVIHEVERETVDGTQPESARSETGSSSSTISTSSFSLSSDFEDRNCPPPTLKKYVGKTDPVARYHYYKSLWDKQKAPGEDRHMQLRWNVRAGTMGKVPCDETGMHIKYLR